MKKFEDKWETEITFKPADNIDKKVAFLQMLYDKSWEKINHFDRLRQQHLNYALIIFSGGGAFAVKNGSTQVGYFTCIGLVLCMMIFCYLDHKLHRYSHGFTSSKLIFAQVMAYLLDNPKDEVAFYQYHMTGEKKAKLLMTMQQRIYLLLMMAAIALCFAIKKQYI